MLKLTTSDDIISVNQMKDGDVAIIIEWASYIGYVGTVVQRYGNHLVASKGFRRFVLGQSASNGWNNFFVNKEKNDLVHRVRKLHEGETLVMS